MWSCWAMDTINRNTVWRYFIMIYNKTYVCQIYKEQQILYHLKNLNDRYLMLLYLNTFLTHHLKWLNNNCKHYSPRGINNVTQTSIFVIMLCVFLERGSTPETSKTDMTYIYMNAGLAAVGTLVVATVIVGIACLRKRTINARYEQTLIIFFYWLCLNWHIAM